jgi:hypothetical protein
VHNHVRARRLPEDDWYDEKGEGFRDQGEAGFRFWLQAPDEGPSLEPCDCGWAPHLQAHYRVVLAKYARVRATTGPQPRAAEPAPHLRNRLSQPLCEAWSVPGSNR